MNARVPMDMDMPESAAGRLLWGASLVRPVDMKFTKGHSLLTVELPPDVVVRTGARYALVDEVDAKDALLCDAMAVPAPEAVVLAAEDSTRFRFVDLYGGDFEVRLGDGVAFTLYFSRPRADRQERAHWWGLEKRKGADGRWWETYLPYYVMDDFGDLVEVPKC